MYRVAVIVLSLLVLGCVQQAEEGMQPGFRDAYDTFVQSGYLREEWSQACIDPLDDWSGLILLANVRNTGEGYEISCHRGESYGALELTDMMLEWERCGQEPDSYDGLAERIYNETHFSPYPLVHLREPIGGRSDTAWVIIRNCHWLDAEKRTQTNLYYCDLHGIKDCQVMSVAYAVQDELGIVYW